MLDIADRFLDLAMTAMTKDGRLRNLKLACECYRQAGNIGMCQWCESTAEQVAKGTINAVHFTV